MGAAAHVGCLRFDMVESRIRESAERGALRLVIRAVKPGCRIYGSELMVLLRKWGLNVLAADIGYWP